MLSQSATIPWAIALTLGASAFILFLLFGSVVIPIKAVLMTLLSITASFGALVFIFQDGNFSNILGFQTPGFTIAGNPIIMFSVLFGLSMDYEVLLLSRMQEAYRRTGDNTASVAEGLAKTAGVITGAALIMVSVFSAFALADSITIKSIGVGMAIAVLIDATIVRILLVPATMRLLGKWNWWAPGPLGRFADRLGFSHAEDELDLAPGAAAAASPAAPRACPRHRRSRRLAGDGDPHPTARPEPLRRQLLRVALGPRRAAPAGPAVDRHLPRRVRRPAPPRAGRCPSTAASATSRSWPPASPRSSPGRSGAARSRSTPARS